MALSKHLSRESQRLRALKQEDLHSIKVASQCIPCQDHPADWHTNICFSNDHLGIVLADASAKDEVGLKYVKSVCDSFIGYLELGVPTEDALIATSGEFTNDDMYFASLIYADIKKTNGTAKATIHHAGHPHAILVRDRKAKHLNLNNKGYALGLDIPQRFFRPTSFDLCKGDLLVLYTDGVTEAVNGRGCEVEEEGLVNLLGSFSRNSPKPARVIRRIFNYMQRYRRLSARTLDDMTLVATYIE